MPGARKVNLRKTRILVVDDHPMVRERLAEVIGQQGDLVVCGEAEDCRQALEAVQTGRPDLVIVDLTLKQSHGLELIRELRAHHPRVAILVVSMHDETFQAERVIQAGAHGYISKQEATRKVLEAIRTVLAGKVYLSSRIMLRMAQGLAGRHRHRPGLPVARLTERELRVFELLGQGHGTRQIARQLGLEMRTVETYRARIKDKLQLKNAHELLQHAIRWSEDGKL